MQARKEEVEYVRSMNLYTKVPIKECLERTGKKPIATRWIDVNKQDASNPLYRSRLVGKEFNSYNDMSLYAATPPLEALRLILHLAATGRPECKDFKIMTNDVSRAYFYAPVKEGQYIYTKLPDEDKNDNEQQMCGRLNFSMYGTRRAATNWQAHYTNVLVRSGFVVCKANNTTFCHPKNKIYCMVHGDDFISTGPASSLKWMENVITQSLSLIHI